MRAKKSLGQHFLTSKQVVEDIVAAADPGGNEIVLEIGPGKGILTRALLEKGAIVHAIELDPRMVEHLTREFGTEIERGLLFIHAQDVLHFDPSVLLSSQSWKLIGNIPYYITGAILRHFLSAACQPQQMVLLVQKEVAERIVAHDLPRRQAGGKESILSISVKTYGTPRIVRKVSKKLFSPAPKVDSAVISIENISKSFFQDIDEDIFFKVVRSGFAHKRKQLAKNLKEIIPEDTLVLFFRETGLSSMVRAEDLSLTEWKQLALRISS